MRCVLPLGFGVSFAVCVVLAASLSGVGCTEGTAPLSDDGGTIDGVAEGSPGDGAAIDAAPNYGVDGAADGGPGDGAASAEGGLSCAQMGTVYEKTCNTVSDCTTVARGCYCGAQPILGIATSVAVAAQVCEKQAANMCALGCANSPGAVAEDGKNTADGGTIHVLCDVGKCHTVLR